MKVALYIASVGVLITIALASGPPFPDSSLILSENNTVVLRSPIDMASATKVQAELLEKSSSLSPRAPLYLVLNSPGGSIMAGQAIVELAKGLGRPVHTVSLFSASMSFIISQYLGKRYATRTATLMSHRAFVGGMEGNIPGSIYSRLASLEVLIRGIHQDVADRAKMDLVSYENLIADELWMDGPLAKSFNFVDEVVTVRCDKSLLGVTEPERMQIAIFEVEVVWYKCPLIEGPQSVKIPSNDPDMINKVNQYFKDKVGFIRSGGLQ